MALVMTPIYTQTVGAGGATSVTFNNIPQFYTDLMLYLSFRSPASTGNATGAEMRCTFNGDTGTNYSNNRISASNTANQTTIASNQTSGRIARTTTNLQTANTFGTHSVYIPNYTNSNFKSYTGDGAIPSNDTNWNLELFAGLWRNAAAITSISITAVGAYNDFSQYSTVSLYGIIRSGA